MHRYRRSRWGGADRSGDAGAARTLVLVAVVIAVLAGGTAAALIGAGASSTASGSVGPVPKPAPTVRVAVAGVRGSTVPWSSPLTFSVHNGTLTRLVATSAAGVALPGQLNRTGWVSTSTLIPGQRYALHAEVVDSSGKASTVTRHVRAAPAEHLLHATVTPSQGTYGIGQPLIVRFDKRVKGAAARAAVLTRLRVTTAPASPGAWRWYNSYEVHYRGPEYWKPGTRLGVTAALDGLRLPGTDVWGAAATVTRHFSIGRAFIATVDITRHVMVVTIDGRVARTVKVSTGRDKYPTKGGVHIVLTRERSHTYNSATVGIPTASPDGYFEKLPYSDRISNAGAFVHANPATVGAQGRRNVSHGCVNTSVADARWFYENSQLGDIVNIIHAVVAPVRSDAGMADWNYSWAQWKTGNLSG